MHRLVEKCSYHIPLHLVRLWDAGKYICLTFLQSDAILTDCKFKMVNHFNYRIFQCEEKVVKKGVKLSAAGTSF
jgi:hypothetical protein